MKYRFQILKSLIVLVLFIISQVTYTSENYKFRTFSPPGGLYFDGVNQIKQDKDGFMWILIEHELFRFDGYEYKRYAADFRSLDSTIKWLFKDMTVTHSGQLLIGTNNGLFSYNKKTNVFDRLLDSEIDQVNVDDFDNIWVKTNGKLGILDVETQELFIPLYDGKSVHYISNIFCANNHELYVSSNYGRIYRYNYNQKEFTQCLILPHSDGLVRGLKKSKGKLWVLVQKYGLYKIDLSTFSIEDHYNLSDQGVHSGSLRCLHVDQKGYVWIGAINGLFVLNTDTNEFSHYTQSLTDPFSIPNNSIWTIEEDLQKNIWIGTYSGGLCYVNSNEKVPFKTFVPEEGGLNHVPVSGFEEGKDYLWIATEGGGLNRMDKKTGKFKYYMNANNSNNISYNNVKSLELDANNNLWISMFRGGLNKFNTDEEHFISYKNEADGKASLLSMDLKKLVLEADSGLWILYQRYKAEISFYSFKRNVFDHYKVKDADNDQYIYDMIKGRGDQLWVLTSQYLYNMDVKKGSFKEIRVNDQISLNARTFCMDDSGNIWIGTNGNGLVKYDTNDLTCSVYDEILKYNLSSILSICYDDMGNLWLGTDNGLYRYNIEANRFSQYDKNDGTQGQMYYPLASMKGMDGKLYFGGTNGFTIIDTKEIVFNKYKPNVIISDFFIDNKPIKSGLNISLTQDYEKKIEVNHNQVNFGFQFSSDNYLIPEKNLFKYRLKGYDNRWIETDAQHRRAEYTKVPAGTYYFEVLAANNDGVWGDTPAVVKIVRKPAPWFSWPAYIIYFVILGAIVYIVYRYYSEKKRLKMQLYMEGLEKEKRDDIHETQLRFFTNISHDFRTPLSLILAAVDRLRMEGLQEYYYRILNGNAQRLLNLVNELMDFRTVENRKMNLELQPVDVNYFVKEIASDFIDYAKQRNITFVVKSDPRLPSSIYIDKNIIEKIVMNLLNNAFKYTKDGGEITIETRNNATFKSKFENFYQIETEDRLYKDVFSIVVCDSGVGISKESIKSVFDRFYKVNTVNHDSHLGTGIGLALVKSLVLLHRGSISIYSERDKGTDMEVVLPLDKNIFKAEDFLKQEEANSFDVKTVEKESDVQKELEVTPVSREKKKKILLAEDNVDLSQLIADSLSDDYEVVMVVNGLEASEELAKTDFDLIISDIMMPLKDGITFCSEVKSNIVTSHIPFILLTAKTSIESKIEGVDSGADMYFEKPIDLNYLKLSISNIFKQQQLLKDHYAKNYFADSSELSSNEQDNKFMMSLINLVEDHLDQSEMDVNYIASELGMSRSKLYTKVKSLTGKSVVEFVLNYRLRKAAKLIIEENMTMKEVMMKIGIESQPYFTNSFKKEFGETPTSFAAKHKKKK